MRTYISGVITLLLLASAGSAQAAARRPPGPLGIVPPHSAAFGPMTRAAARGEFTPSPGGGATVNYNGGPVMHSVAVYTIFWEPANPPLGVSQLPSGYRLTVDNYLRDVAADSGKPSNAFSVLPQYTDAVGPAQYNVTFGGFYDDTTTAYPVLSGCTDGDGSGHNLPVCLTDANIQGEVQNAINANGWPTGLGALYLLFTPEGVGSCGPGGSACAYFQGGYCAYHGSYDDGSGNVIYANLPYEATFTFGLANTTVAGCEDGSRPNGSTAGPAIDSASHEQAEAVTDPLATGSGSWWDSTGTQCTGPGSTPAGCNPFYGQEIADLCVNYQSPLDWYGPMLATSPPYLVPNGGNDANAANEAIGSTFNSAGFDPWLLQQEWSNAAGACVQRVPRASFTATPAAAGSPMSFDGSGSTASSGHAGDPVTITNWQWSFDDGTSAAGQTTSHTFCTPGTHQVTLTVTDSAGDTGAAAEPVIVGGVACGTPTTPVTTPKVAPPPPPKPTLSLKLRQHGKKIALGTLSCPAGCVLNARAVANVARKAGRRVRVTHTAIGTLTVTVRPGHRATLTLTLSPSGKALLHRLHRLSVTVTIRLSGPTGTTNAVRRLVLRG
jgi:PKD domain